MTARISSQKQGLRSPLRRRHLSLLAVLAMGSSRRVLIQAYINSGLPAHTQRAWLQKLTDDICLSEPGNLSQEEIHNAPMLMSAWAKTPKKEESSSSGKKGKERAVAVEGLLKRMIDERRAGNTNAIVRTQDYNAVMKSWVNSGEMNAAAERVEQILRNMQDKFVEGDEHVQPNAESFELAIEAWTIASDVDYAPARAHKILEWTNHLYTSSENDKAAPNTNCFHLVLRAWASSGKLEAPIMSEHLIMWMQHLQQQGLESAKPNTMCFNTVMAAWLKSGDITAEKRIRQIFEFMELSSRKGNTDIKPDSSSYNIVISSISPAVKKLYDSGGARRADKILARLEMGFLGGDESLRPDTIIYNQVIDFWAKAQSIHGHYLKARDVLDRQIAMYESGVRKCRPDVMSYTSVIAACASTYGSKKERRRAFDLAHKTFIESCRNKFSHPNDVTYGLMFKAVGRLLNKADEKDRYARTLFNLCCGDGCFGEMAFLRMKEAASPELLKELTNDCEYDGLPKEWRRKVVTPRRSSNASKKSKTMTDLRP